MLVTFGYCVPIVSCWPASVTNLKTVLGYSYMLTKLNFELKRSREEEAALEHCVYIMSAIGSKERRSRFFNDSYIL